MVVEKYSNSSYIYLLKNLSPTGNIRVQEEIKRGFYYDRKNMNLKCECLWRINNRYNQERINPIINYMEKTTCLNYV